MKTQISISLLLLSILGSNAFGQSQYPTPVGKIHPDFKLPSIDGDKTISLSDFRGKKVLLVHFASW